MEHPRYESWLKHKDYIIRTVVKSSSTIESIISSAFQFGWNAGSNYEESKVTSDNKGIPKCKSCKHADKTLRASNCLYNYTPGTDGCFALRKYL
jgi:hypothetical protein